MKIPHTHIPILSKDRNRFKLWAALSLAAITIFVSFVILCQVSLMSSLISGGIGVSLLGGLWYWRDFSNSYYVRTGDCEFNSLGIRTGHWKSGVTEYNWSDLESFHVIGHTEDPAEVHVELIEEGEFVALLSFGGEEGTSSVYTLLTDELLSLLQEKEQEIENSKAVNSVMIEQPTLDTNKNLALLYMSNLVIFSAMAFAFSGYGAFVITLCLMCGFFGFPLMVFSGDGNPFKENGKLTITESEILIQQKGKEPVSIKVEDCAKLELDIRKGHKGEGASQGHWTGVNFLRIKSRNYSGEVRFRTPDGSVEAQLIKLFFQNWKRKYPKVMSYIGRYPGTVYTAEMTETNLIAEPPLFALDSKPEEKANE